MDSAEKLAMFGPGPWVDEPDREEFKAFGLPCLVTRNPVFGNLCGYVAVLPGHPLHGCSLADVQDQRFDVHGGVTYASPCSGLICHVPEPGEPDDVWWFGFDAGHMGRDLSPELVGGRMSKILPATALRHMRGVYRDIEYIRSNVEKLAAQLAAAAIPLREHKPGTGAG